MLNPAVVDFPNPKAHRADFWRHLVNDEALQDCDDLEKLVAEVRLFASPLLAAAGGEGPFKARWRAGGLLERT